MEEIKKMNDSILESIKKLIGFPESYTHFDQDLIIAINSAFFSLSQLGLSVFDSFKIVDSTDTWSNCISNIANLDAIKSFVYLKVKLLFDPPNNSSLIENIEKQIAELEWRILVEHDC